MKLESLKLEKFRNNELSRGQLQNINGSNMCTGGGFYNSYVTNSKGKLVLARTVTYDGDSVDETGRITYCGQKISVFMKNIWS